MDGGRAHAHEQEGGPVEVLVLGGDRPPAKEGQAGGPDDAPIDIRVVAPPPADDDSAATAPAAAEGTHGQGQGHERRRSRSLEEAALRPPAPLPPPSGSAAPSPAKPHSKGGIPSSSSSASLSGRLARVLSWGGGHAVAPEEGGSVRSLASLGRVRACF